VRTIAPSMPLPIRIATLRVLMPVSPGRLSKDSGGDGSYSGSGKLVASGCGAGTSMPSPWATAPASIGSTLTSMDTTRSRTAGVCTRVSSKRKAAAMWACSTGDWLLKNRRACE
jgi:hypothetical protein